MTKSTEARELAATFGTGDPAHKLLHDLADEINELRTELAESDALRDKMGDILTRSVNAIRGEPEPLSMHSWDDLPELIKGQVKPEPADTDILKLAHRMAWRYTHSMQPSNIEYTFNNRTLLDFVRALRGLK